MNEKMEKFKKELKELLNKHSIENECDMPDFLLAEMVVNFILAVEEPIKKNLDWHECDSTCHPKKPITKRKTNQQIKKRIKMSKLPTVEEAGAIAIDISEKLPELLETHEQAFFIAGFQEAVKYLSVIS